MRTALDIADWIIRHRSDHFGAPIEEMSLQKVAFYAQSFHLALRNRALFGDEIEAWGHGPVIPAVHRRYSQFGAQPILPNGGKPAAIDDQTEAWLGELLSFFGGRHPAQLSAACRGEEPWQNARAGRSDRQPTIPARALRTYYSGLMEEGEEALSRHGRLGHVPQPRWAWLYVAGICSRSMDRHPFYRWELAIRLGDPTGTAAPLPDELFAPPLPGEAADHIEVDLSPDLSPGERRKKLTDALGSCCMSIFG